MKKDILIRRYKTSVSLGIPLQCLDCNAMAGYYLFNYQGAPVEALVHDVQNLRVPSTIAAASKVIIVSALDEQRYCHSR